MKIKSLFISDTHFGVKRNQAKEFLNVIDSYEYENLFLVGDIIDIQSMEKKVFWKKEYGKIINRLTELSKSVNIVYITGNHDAVLRQFSPRHTAFCQIVDEYVYGDTLIIHGDKFDTLIKRWKRIYKLGDLGYNILIRIDSMLGTRGGISRHGKKVVKNMSNYLNSFYTAAEKYAKYKKCKKIICGHTHIQEYRDLNGVAYYNCGDFRESVNFIIEHADGSLESISR